MKAISPASIAAAFLLKSVCAFPQYAERLSLDKRHIPSLEQVEGSFLDRRQAPAPAPAPAAGGNEFVAPGGDDQRSPCPGLNTLANHGFINHNGQGITAENVITAFNLAFGFDRSIVEVGAGNAVALQNRVNPLADTTTFNLNTMALPHQIEHDGSLTRDDSNTTWNQHANNNDFNCTVWSNTLDLFGPGDHVNILGASTAVIGRYVWAAQNDFPGSNIPAQGGSAAEAAFYLMAFNDPAQNPDLTNPQARVDWLDYWVNRQQLPHELGWNKPSTIASAPYFAVSTAVFNSIQASSSTSAAARTDHGLCGGPPPPPPTTTSEPTTSASGPTDTNPPGGSTTANPPGGTTSTNPPGGSTNTNPPGGSTNTNPSGGSTNTIPSSGPTIPTPPTPPTNGPPPIPSTTTTSTSSQPGVPGTGTTTSTYPPGVPGTPGAPTPTPVTPTSIPAPPGAYPPGLNPPASNPPGSNPAGSYPGGSYQQGTTTGTTSYPYKPQNPLGASTPPISNTIAAVSANAPTGLPSISSLPTVPAAASSSALATAVAHVGTPPTVPNAYLTELTASQWGDVITIVNIYITSFQQVYLGLIGCQGLNGLTMPGVPDYPTFSDAPWLAGQMDHRPPQGALGGAFAPLPSTLLPPAPSSGAAAPAPSSYPGYVPSYVPQINQAAVGSGPALGPASTCACQ